MDVINVRMMVEEQIKILLLKNQILNIITYMTIRWLNIKLQIQKSKLYVKNMVFLRKHQKII